MLCDREINVLAQALAKKVLSTDWQSENECSTMNRVVASLRPHLQQLVMQQPELQDLRSGRLAATLDWPEAVAQASSCNVLRPEHATVMLRPPPCACQYIVLLILLFSGRCLGARAPLTHMLCCC